MNETTKEYVARLRTGGSNQHEAADRIEDLERGAKEKHYEECALICKAFEYQIVVPEAGCGSDREYLTGVVRGINWCANQIRLALCTSRGEVK